MVKTAPLLDTYFSAHAVLMPQPFVELPLVLTIHLIEGFKLGLELALDLVDEGDGLTSCSAIEVCPLAVILVLD